jgi:HK97 family phage portal protein
VYRRTETGREVVRDEPVMDLIARRPNAFQSAFEFREMLTIHAVLSHGGFAYIGRVGGKPAELLPLDPTWVTPKRKSDWTVEFEVRPTLQDGTLAPFTVKADDMLVVRGPSWSGYRALDAVTLAREAIGLSLSTEEAHARLHKNGARVAGVYSIEGTLTTEQHAQLRAFLANYEGAANTGRTMILDRAAKFTSQTMSGVDAQHLETRRFQIEEVCRALRVYPQMIGHADKTATYASAEQFFLAHVVHSLMPWVIRWEQAIDRALLGGDGQLYSKFSVQGLLRGDAKTRAAFYGAGIKDGWLTRNEAREFEELDPLDGLDVPLMPLNMADGTEPPKDQTQDNAGSAPPADAGDKPQG